MGCATLTTQQSLAQNEKSKDCKTQTTRNITSSQLVELLRKPNGEEFPGDVLFHDRFGKYIVAARDFIEGEKIWEEYPLIISAGGNVPETCTGNLTCLSCYRRCKPRAKCSKCGWPICGYICEQATLHANYECKILQNNKIFLQNLYYDYVSIKILRCLLLREYDPIKWNSLVNNHDAQYGNRIKDQRLEELRNYVLDFLFCKCELGSKYDAFLVDIIMGIMATNEFCLSSDSSRDALLLFDKSSYFAHSCSPNMDAIWIFHPTQDSSYNQNYFCLKFYANENISKGEMLTHSYIYYSSSVVRRQEHLWKNYYFKCDCNKCRTDLFDKLPYKLYNN